MITSSRQGEGREFYVKLIALLILTTKLKWHEFVEIQLSNSNAKVSTWKSNQQKRNWTNLTPITRWMLSKCFRGRVAIKPLISKLSKCWLAISAVNTVREEKVIRRKGAACLQIKWCPFSGGHLHNMKSLNVTKN